MIELEIYPSRSPHHSISIYFKGNLAGKTERATLSDLEDLRNALANELLWIDGYLKQEEPNDSE